MTKSERYHHREKAQAKAASARATELERRAPVDPACAYCGEKPARRCRAGDGRNVVYRCAGCWPKTVA